MMIYVAITKKPIRLLKKTKQKTHISKQGHLKPPTEHEHNTTPLTVQHVQHC